MGEHFFPESLILARKLIMFGKCNLSHMEGAEGGGEHFDKPWETTEGEGVGGGYPLPRRGLSGKLDTNTSSWVHCKAYININLAENVYLFSTRGGGPFSDVKKI